MSETTLAQALLTAQEEMPAVDKDGTNPHFKSSFTTLGNLLSKVRPVLNKNGLALVQAPAMEDGQFVLTTTILHTSGDKLTFSAPLAPVKNDPQAQGSAITYMRRYSLASFLAIADQEDDDGNAATAPNGQEANGITEVDSATAADIQRRSKMGFASDKQEGFCKSLLSKAGFDSDAVTRISGYLATRPRKDVGKAMDGLNPEKAEPDDMEAMKMRLAKAATLWAESN